MDNKDSKYNILIFKDEIDQQLLLKRILIKLGFNVTCVSTSDLGLDLFGKDKFDAVLMDYELAPESSLDGIETLKEIRKKNFTIPVLIMTGYASQELAIKSIKAKSDDFLVKPVDYSKLGLTIKESIKKKKQLFPEEKDQLDKKDIPLNFDLFKYLIILKNSIPMYFKGQWGENVDRSVIHSKHGLEDQLLMSSFLNAMQTLSKSLFGQSVNEILLGNWKIIFKQRGAIL